MRNDMYDRILQRSRPVGCVRRKNRAPRDIEQRPAREPLGHRLPGLDRRSLRPLQRYLEKQVGRTWDEVYSDLYRPLDRRDRLRRDIERSLPDLVAATTVRRDRGVYALCSWYGLRPLAEIRQRLYVDPDSGRLLRNQPALDADAQRRRARNQRLLEQRVGWQPEFRTLGAMAQLHRIDGIWYEVRLAQVPSPAPRPATGARSRSMKQAFAYDMLLQQAVHRCNGARCSRYGRCDLYACEKRQLNHRELVEHRLKNDTAPEIYDAYFRCRPWRRPGKYRGPIRAGGRHKEH